MAEELNPFSIVDEEMGDSSPKSDEYGQISIRVNKPDYEKVIQIQGLMMLEKGGKKIPISQVLHEMIEKWDSLIKSYNLLKDLPQVE